MTNSGKPRIGITPCTAIDDYVKSIERAGAEPVVLSNDDDPAAVLDRVDGVLLTGGPDVDPGLYRQEKHATTQIARARDHFEVPLAQRAVRQDVPLFAICRGIQVLNVAEGGTLVQDIPSSKQTDLNHAINQPKNHPSHEIAVTHGTKLAAALGGVTPGESCAVNSRHHQAVDKVAPGFVQSAVSPDGIIEGIERPASTFCVGVQWHPENFWRTGEFAGLFDALVEAARARKEREALDVGRVGKKVERSQ